MLFPFLDSLPESRTRILVLGALICFLVLKALLVRDMVLMLRSFHLNYNRLSEEPSSQGYAAFQDHSMPLDKPVAQAASAPRTTSPLHTLLASKIWYASFYR